MSYLIKNSPPLQKLPPPLPPSPSSNGNKISPAVLFIIIILAVIFFVSGLLHLLVRFLIKKHPSRSRRRNPDDPVANSDALQRQLQQLFDLHDSGLDQAFIDALPVFLYREVIGSKEPFDCAVCLCEFSPDDHLRLLPICGHAFHLDCIDTWLLSNSTCPLCRGPLFVQGVPIENPVFDFDDESTLEEGAAVPVRLGKFRSTESNGEGNVITRREEGESSSSNLDARRCYSMGSYRYIVGDANLRVVLSGKKGTEKESRTGDEEGKRIGVARKGESFSVSKIWLWKNKKGKFPDDGVLPWMDARRSEGDI